MNPNDPQAAFEAEVSDRVASVLGRETMARIRAEAAAEFREVQANELLRRLQESQAKVAELAAQVPQKKARRRKADAEAV